jgi:CheY-like chemotaxis protein
LNNVLVIDDDPDFSYVFSLILGTLGYTCEIVNTAQNAITVLDHGYKNFSAVFLDIMLKEIDGIEFAKELKNKYKGIKLIMLSAMSESVKTDILEKSGAHDFLSKPIDRSKLKILLSK